MNKYFKSIGFSKFNIESSDSSIVNDILINPDSRNIIQVEDDVMFFEYYKYYNNHIGLLIKGTELELEDVNVRNITPFVSTDNYINVTEYEVIENNNYSIMNCDDEETGNQLSFYLHNYIDYYNNKFSRKTPNVNIVGLSLFGKIIIPISHEVDYKNKKRKEEENFKELVKKARKGDEAAEETLISISDKTNKTIQKRLKDENFFSVIDGYFLPVKAQLPTYCILGTILKIKKIKNSFTKEDMYLFTLDIKGSVLEICINSNDLIGMPTLGMRFMGQCALQGKIFY